MLGITGYRFVGKSEAITYLVEKKDFQPYSISTTLRRLAAKQGIAGDRRGALQDFGDELRKEHGPGWLAVQTMREIRRDHLSHHHNTGLPARIVVGGFKRPEELEVFRAIREFAAIAITTQSDEVRWQRAKERGMLAYDLGLESGVDVSLEQFHKDVDERDRFGRVGDAGYGQAVEAVVEAIGPEDQIENDGDVPALLGSLNDKVRQLDRRYRHPRA